MTLARQEIPLAVLRRPVKSAVRPLRTVMLAASILSSNPPAETTVAEVAEGVGVGLGVKVGVGDAVGDGVGVEVGVGEGVAVGVPAGVGLASPAALPSSSSRSSSSVMAAIGISYVLEAITGS